jgi:hypothetical protein
MVAFDEGATVKMLAVSCGVLYAPRRAIDCAVGPILSICAEISGSVEISRE